MATILEEFKAPDGYDIKCSVVINGNTEIRTFHFFSGKPANTQSAVNIEESKLNSILTTFSITSEDGTVITGAL